LRRHNGVAHVARKRCRTHGVHPHAHPHPITPYLRPHTHPTTHTPAATATAAPTSHHHSSAAAAPAASKSSAGCKTLPPTAPSKTLAHLAHGPCPHLAHASLAEVLLVEAAAPAAALLLEHAKATRGSPGHHHISTIQLLPV
jgi:hypothetical protein